jgi:hypothetical protein
MKLPTPTSGYSRADQQEVRRTLELADRDNHKRNRDVEIGAGRLILTSPNGTRYSITVDNAGVISAVAV